MTLLTPNIFDGFDTGSEGEAGGQDSRPKRISSFLFHPFLPFALSIQQTFMQPTVMNIHFWRWSSSLRRVYCGGTEQQRYFKRRQML